VNPDQVEIVALRSEGPPPAQHTIEHAPALTRVPQLEAHVPGRLDRHAASEGDLEGPWLQQAPGYPGHPVHDALPEPLTYPSHSGHSRPGVGPRGA